MSVEFEKTNWIWQIQKYTQGVVEWFELQFTPKTFPNIKPPKITFPTWLLEVLWQIFQVLVSVGLVILVIWIVWQLLELLSPYLKSRPSSTDQSTDILVKLSVNEWLKKSQQYRQAGNYKQAFYALYMGLLQYLDDRQIAPHQPSRTDGEYLTVLNHQTNNYNILFNTHDRICFGGKEVTLELLDECQTIYQIGVKDTQNEIK